MPTHHPNILLVHCHDLGQYLGCYGINTAQTAHLDAFAARGVRFENSYCAAPSCSLSRSALFSGRYPHSNGVMGLTHAKFAWDLHPAERHLAQILVEQGFITAAVGVVHETGQGPQRSGYQRYQRGGTAEMTADAAIELLTQFRQAARHRRSAAGRAGAVASPPQDAGFFTDDLD